MITLKVVIAIFCSFLPHLCLQSVLEQLCSYFCALNRTLDHRGVLEAQFFSALFSYSFLSVAQRYLLETALPRWTLSFMVLFWVLFYSFGEGSRIKRFRGLTVAHKDVEWKFFRITG